MATAVHGRAESEQLLIPELQAVEDSSTGAGAILSPRRASGKVRLAATVATALAAAALFAAAWASALAAKPPHDAARRSGHDDGALIVADVLVGGATCGPESGDMDFEYYDLAGAGKIDALGSSAACCESCKATADCEAYTFVALANVCFLKKGMPTRKTPKPGYVSAVMVPATVSPASAGAVYGTVGGTEAAVAPVVVTDVAGAGAAGGVPATQFATGGLPAVAAAAGGYPSAPAVGAGFIPPPPSSPYPGTAPAAGAASAAGAAPAAATGASTAAAIGAGPAVATGATAAAAVGAGAAAATTGAVPPPPPPPPPPPAANTTPGDVMEAADARTTVAADLSGCAASGGGCLKSQCCKSPGEQCYTKNAFWAQCMVSCTKGPNPLDQVSPDPWECKELGKRTPGTPFKCSKDGEDCRTTKCCDTGGYQCYEKNTYWAACKASCQPGPDLTADDNAPWTCKEIGSRTPGAAPWVAEKCAKAGADCKDVMCCAEPGMQCYKQTDYYAQCKQSCTPGEKANDWEQAWSCDTLGARTPANSNSPPPSGGKVGKWVADTCAADGENCIESQCCHAVGGQCYTKNEFWAACRTSCTNEPDPADGNKSWTCKALGPKSWGLALKGYPSLYCFSLFMPSSYEGGLMTAQLKEGAGIFSCDGYDVYAADNVTLGTSLDSVVVRSVLIPHIEVGVSQDGTAGNAKLFMAVWDKVIAGGRFRDYDFTCKVDPDAVLVAWRLRDHMRSHIGENVYVVNCNKFPGSPNFPMMYGALEVFTQPAMVRYAENSWKCGQQLPWGSWGEDYYMTHCMDFIGVGRIGDFGILGDNMCTGANCGDGGISAFHPFKSEAAWMGCWNTAKR